FSPEADKALALARAVAAAGGAAVELHLVHVLGDGDRRRVVGALAQVARSAGATTARHVVTRDRATAIARAASELGADLLVLGRRGPLAERLMIAAPCPVWIPSAAHEGRWRKIVCAVDFSEASFLALAHAAHLAGRFGAELGIVHVRSGDLP